MLPQVSEVRSYASFDFAWEPDAYLAQYYNAVENDERATLRFLSACAATIGPVPALLEFGCGPTIHHLFPFVAQADEIHVADYLPVNLLAIRRWIERAPDAHDWSIFAAHVLRCELGRPATVGEVATREQRTRQRIAAFLQADARSTQAIHGRGALREYPVVLCCFCPDSITADLEEWRRCTLNIASLVAPRGWLVLAALRATTAYRVGGVHYPSARVTEQDVTCVLAEAGFAPSSTTVTVAAAPDDRGFGFSSVILAMGRRAWT